MVTMKRYILTAKYEFTAKSPKEANELAREAMHNGIFGLWVLEEKK